MKIDIAQLLEKTGATLEKKGELELTGHELDEEGSRLVEPVSFEFSIFHSEAGLLSVDCNYQTQLEFPCGRCLKPIEKTLSEFISGLYVPTNYQREVELDEEQYRIEYSKGAIEPWQLIRQDVLVKIPMRPLCSEDCKGLCPDCGQNLNEGDCGHEQEKIDPRLEKLQDIDIEE